MHSIRLFSPRRLALLLLIGIPVITFISVGQILSVHSDGVRVLKRDGSTITFTLPWNSAITPVISNIKIASNNGITNVVEVLTNGGISVGQTGVEDGPGSMSIVPNIIDGSLTTISNNPVNTAVGQGELLNAGTSLVGQVLSTALSASNVGALNTDKPTSSSDTSHTSSHGCGCSLCGCAFPTPPYPANSTLGAATSSMPMMTSACKVTPTVTETWHSTHYAETATMYSFMSIITVTCTETVNLCPSSLYLAPNNMTSPPQATGLVQCANGVFMEAKEDCAPMMMNNSTLPGHSNAPCYSCSACSSGEFCPPSTPAQVCPCGLGWPCADCSGGWFCPPLAAPILTPITRNNGTNGTSSPNSSMSSSILPMSSMSRNMTASPPDITSSKLSPTGTALVSVSFTSSLAQPTFSPKSTPSVVANITTNAGQSTLSTNKPNSILINTTSSLSQSSNTSDSTALTPANITSSPIQATLLPNSAGSVPGNGTKFNNITSLIQPASIPPLDETAGLRSSRLSLLATNASVVLPTQIGNVISSPSFLLPTITPLGLNSTTGSSVISSLIGATASPSMPPLPSLGTPPANQNTNIPINVSDYGARVQQGVESGVKGALSNIEGLSGSLLSTVLAEINSVLAVALSTAAPTPNKIGAILPVSPTPDINNLVAILPTASQAFNNGFGGVPAVATPSPTTVKNLISASPPIASNVIGIVPRPLLAAANGAPRIFPA